MYFKNTHRYLHLGYDKSGNRLWICTQEETAQFFGWATMPIYQWQPPPGAPVVNGTLLIRDPGPRRQGIGGTQCRICRSPSRDGWPRGKTHILRISTGVTNRHMAELAYHANADWYWMESRNGHRRTREEWLQIHHAMAMNGGGP